MRLGKLDVARKHFEEAVRSFNKHLWSIFALGELSMAAGDTAAALQRFSEVAAVKETLYEGEALQEEARKFATMDVSQLTTTWQTRKCGNM